MKRDGDKLDIAIGGRIITWGRNFVRNGYGIEGAVMTVVAEFGLKGGGGSVDGEIPLA